MTDQKKSRHVRAKHILLSIEDLLNNFYDKKYKEKEKNYKGSKAPPYNLLMGKAITALTGIKRDKLNAWHALDKALEGKFFLPQLLEMSKSEVNGLGSLGKKTLEFIEEAVQDLGYSLGQLSGNTGLEEMKEKGQERRKKWEEECRVSGYRMSQSIWYSLGSSNKKRLAFIQGLKEEAEVDLMKIYDLDPQMICGATGTTPNNHPHHIENLIATALQNHPQFGKISEALTSKFMVQVLADNPKLVTDFSDGLTKAVKKALSSEERKPNASTTNSTDSSPSAPDEPS